MGEDRTITYDSVMGVQVLNRKVVDRGLGHSGRGNLFDCDRYAVAVE